MNKKATVGILTLVIVVSTALVTYLNQPAPIAPIIVSDSTIVDTTKTDSAVFVADTAKVDSLKK
jgi:hypothetical protein